VAPSGEFFYRRNIIKTLTRTHSLTHSITYSLCPLAYAGVIKSERKTLRIEMGQQATGNTASNQITSHIRSHHNHDTTPFVTSHRTSRHIIHHMTSHCLTSHHKTHHIEARHTTSQHFTSISINSNHITLRHVMSCYIS